MIFQALTRKEDEKRASFPFVATVVTVVRTSLDAMAVSVSLTFLNVNISLIAISLAALVMSSIGVLAGRFLEQCFGRIAEAASGCALFGLEEMILFEHLTAG